MLSSSETGDDNDDNFSAPHFRDDEAARKFLEDLLWPDGPVCPHCGVINHAYETKRAGVFRCAEKACRKDFTVTMRTVMERAISPCTSGTGLPFMTSSKKGCAPIRCIDRWASPIDPHGSCRIVLARRCGQAGWLRWAATAELSRSTKLYRSKARHQSAAGPGPSKDAVMTLVERAAQRIFHVDEAPKRTLSRSSATISIARRHVMTDEAADTAQGGKLAHTVPWTILAASTDT